MIKNSEAIVLRTRKFRDSDMQLVLLSPELGKIHTVAWGAFQRNHALLSFCQILNYGTVSLSVQAGKSFALRQVADTQVFSGIKKHNHKLAAACFFVEVLSGLVEDRQPEPGLFYLLKGYLYALDTLTGEYDRGIQVVFLLHLMKICGYGPVFNTCLTFQDFLATHSEALYGSTLRPANQTLSSLRIASSDWTKIQALEQFSFGIEPFPQDINPDILILLETYLFSILGYQPKSLSFYRQIRGF